MCIKENFELIYKVDPETAFDYVQWICDQLENCPSCGWQDGEHAPGCAYTIED